MRTMIVFLALLALCMAACSVNPETDEPVGLESVESVTPVNPVNPVTPKWESVAAASEEEIVLGKQHFGPMQQSQGGVYDVDPELSSYVQRVGDRVASQSGVVLEYEFVILNNSEPNAWAIAGGKVAINHGLLTALQSEAELATVLGHEIVHAATHRATQQISRTRVLQLGAAATAIAMSDGNYGNLIPGGTRLAAQAGLPKYGPEAELRSDFYGMHYMSGAGYDPQGAVALQRRWLGLADERPSDWVNGLFASHPPSAKRLQASIATAGALSASGDQGTNEFQAVMQKTMGTMPAYAAYDEGRKALSEAKFDVAIGLAEEAIGLYGEEAHFYALRADIRLAEGEYAKATTSYNRAINRRPGFFYYYLQRGIANKELGHFDNAVTDLKRSIELMPTAPAYFALGRVAEERRERYEAIGHFKAATKTKGEYGTAAMTAVVRLELPAYPGAYTTKTCTVDGSGNLVVTVTNDTGVTIGDVQVAVSYTDSSDGTIRKRYSIVGEIGPGKSGSVNTGTDLYTQGSKCPAEVIAAAIAE